MTLFSVDEIVEKLRGTDSLALIAKGAGVAIAIQAAGVLVRYALQVLLARWLGPAEYGKYAFALSWAQVLSVPAGLGLATASLRFIPEYRARAEFDKLRGFMRRSWQLVLMGGFASGLIGLGIALIFQHARSPFAVPLMAGMAIVPLLALLTLQSETARAYGRVSLSLLPMWLARPALVIIFSALAVWFTGALNSVQVLLFVALALLLVSAAQLVRIHRHVPAPARAAAPEFRTFHWLRISTPLLLIAGFSMLLSETDILMVGGFLGPSNAGVYSAAVRIATLVGFVLISVNVLAAPTFASLYAQHRREELQRLLARLSHLIFWPSLLLALLMIVLSRYLLLLFGPAFMQARLPLIVLILGQLVLAATGSVNYLMDLTGHQDQSAKVLGACAVLNVALNYVGIQAFGLAGAAVATALTLLVCSVWLHHLVFKNLKVRPSILSSLKTRAGRSG